MSWDNPTKEEIECAERRLMNGYASLSYVVEHRDLSIVAEWLIREALGTVRHALPKLEEELKRRAS